MSSSLAAGPNSLGTNDRPATPEFPPAEEAVLPALPRHHVAATTRLSTPKSLSKPTDTDTDIDTRDACTVSVLAAQQRVKLVKGKDGNWLPAPDARLVNNLSWVVGFMELANACDFAANVWNSIPVPLYAVVLMAIGGSVAGFLSIFAFRDAKRACYNCRYLRKQRTLLLQEKSQRQREAKFDSTMELDVVLDINTRELGTELLARWIMDLLMGCGAILISIGTFMAIGGADPKVFLASNLLSGYVGNTPIALFGLVNSSWAGFVFFKAQGHVTASRRLLGSCTAAALVKRRARRVQAFSVINGTATILGGAGSMVTATRWWGYLILLPVIISSILCNMWWRRVIGYTRSEGHPNMVSEELSKALELAAAAKVRSRHDAEALKWCSEMPTRLGDMLSFLSLHSLFHQYCLEALANTELRQALGGNDCDATALEISPYDIFALPCELHPMLMDAAKKVVDSVTQDHFTNRERYLSELLGTYCSIVWKQGRLDKQDLEKA
ncbi:uncharacterized protein UV8b_07702 [Ustilaginoidea virens]|uniref:Uncharacterized protein n=1 Tax=Ustilaginoidea virens TaxID=1159556 RepID=A0A063BUE7_USTVR|nr:uncharacterized protein UV8b_07702 [Ustilaginoidea virens]QUC23461.1 hypothetical protein UV8b_07702 [Ustilaginoidea virens]GAO18003.1 hypothetical protein UVI_02060250 [Ustilaginoidea virens]